MSWVLLNFWGVEKGGLAFMVVLCCVFALFCSEL